jgi:hypothetical protein
LPPSPESSPTFFGILMILVLSSGQRGLRLPPAAQLGPAYDIPIGTVIPERSSISSARAMPTAWVLFSTAVQPFHSLEHI